jgi:hypothetical protein
VASGNVTDLDSSDRPDHTWRRPGGTLTTGERTK